MKRILEYLTGRAEQGWRRSLYQRTPVVVDELARKRKDLERLLVLAGRPEGDALWQTVLSYADEHARNELLTALGPNLSNEQRQYAAGRAAGAEDWASALRDLRIAAEREGNRLKRGN